MSRTLCFPFVRPRSSSGFVTGHHALTPVASKRLQPIIFRTLSTTPVKNVRTHLNRSYLYGICTHCSCSYREPELPTVPAASERMLQKSLVTKSDVIIYDLEDSVPPTKTDKESARERLVHFLQVCSELLRILGITPLTVLRADEA